MEESTTKHRFLYEIQIDGIVGSTNPLYKGPYNMSVDINISNNNVPKDVNNEIQTQQDSFPKDLTRVPNKDIDELFPSNDVWTTARDGAVKLRLESSKEFPEKPVTVQTAFRDTAKKSPNVLALAVKRNNTWIKWTFKQYLDDIYRAAKSYIEVGLAPFQSVCILGFNSPEWFIANLGAIFAGGLSCGIYATNSPEACQYIAEHAKASVIVCENDQQLQKIMKVREHLPYLKVLVQYSGEVVEKQPFIYAWEQFLELGKNLPDSVITEREKLTGPNKCCALIYTSGTTGNPKGVMLSHDNLIYTSKCVEHSLTYEYGRERLVSYLPLSHSAAQILDMYLPVHMAMSIYFAQPDALRGTLGDTLKEVKPTFFFGVPRVYEKMMEKIQAVGREASGFKKSIANWAKNIGLKGNYAKIEGKSVPWGWSLANRLVFSKVRAALGFIEIKHAAAGAAPMTREALDFFLSLNLPVLETFGMTESTGPQASNFPNRAKVGSAGRDVLGLRTVVIDPDEEGNGELCICGRNVMMGYLDDEKKTRETFTEEGWLRSGDIAKKDQDGFIFITGRIKELLITAGGENIAPVPIEDHVKEALPVVSNCMLIGDKKKFLSMLITLKTEVNLETMEPMDTLTKEVKAWCKTLGSDATTVTEVISHGEESIMKAIQAGIDKANSKSVSRAQKIQKWSLLPTDFSMPGGELGPTLKLKRPCVVKKYDDTISRFYVD